MRAKPSSGLGCQSTARNHRPQWTRQPKQPVAAASRSAIKFRYKTTTKTTTDNSNKNPTLPRACEVIALESPGQSVVEALPDGVKWVSVGAVMWPWWWRRHWRGSRRKVTWHRLQTLRSTPANEDSGHCGGVTDDCFLSTCSDSVS